MNPIIIDANFLNPVELEDIKTKIFMLRDQWKEAFGPSDVDPFLIARMIPSGMYAKQLHEQDVIATNNVMSSYFRYYYNKIKDKLSHYYNVPVDYSSSLQLPGFHIFLNSSETQKIQSNYVNFHKDTFPQLQDFVSLGKIESIIIPISLPSSGGSLLWSNSEYRQDLENRYKPQTDLDNLFHYEEGMIAVWPGDLPHCTAPFTLLNSSESRITLQMHINLLDDRGIVFW